MTSTEAKDALLSRMPVKYNGIIYSHISAIIYRLGEQNEITVSVELYDKSGNCVVIAKPKDVTTYHD